MKRLAVPLLLAVWLGAVAADACQPAPPPAPPPPPEIGEAPEAYAARIAALEEARVAEIAALELARQRDLWDQSEFVLIARVERPSTYDPLILAESNRVQMRPVRWLKGSGGSRRFSLAYLGQTSCGPYPLFDAFRGALGDTFVVFVREGRPQPTSVLDAMRPERAIEPRLRAALDAQP